MNLADLLCYADIQQLTEIANHYRCECKAFSKNELIQAILQAIYSREVMDAFIQAMQTEDIRFIATMLYEDKLGYSLEELTARARQARFGLPGQDVESSRQLIAACKQRGWLFQGYSQQTRYLLMIPDDLKKRIGRSIVGRFHHSMIYTSEPIAYRDEQMFMCEDIRHFLNYIQNNDVPLTTDGAIYKRVLMMLLDEFAVKEEPLSRVGFRFGYGRRFRDYPDRFSFIYDYCYYHTLIAETEGVLQLTEQGRRFVEEQRKVELASMFRLWIRLYRGAIPNILAIVNWILELSNDWVKVSCLISCLHPLVKSYYYDSTEVVLERRVIRMLMHLGLVQLGEHQQEGAVIRATTRSNCDVRATKVNAEDTIVLPKMLV